MAENDGTQEPAEGSASKSETRQYGIYKSITGTAAEIKDEIHNLLDDGNESDQTTVMVRVAVAVEENPRKAMITAANLKKLNGTFKVIADGSMTEFPVETETKTVTKIGKSDSGD